MDASHVPYEAHEATLHKKKGVWHCPAAQRGLRVWAPS